MNISKTTIAAAVVTSPATTTITLAGLDEGQVRRFERIMRAQANNEPYDGELTTEFAREVVAQLD